MSVLPDIVTILTWFAGITAIVISFFNEGAEGMQWLHTGLLFLIWFEVKIK